MVNENFAVFYFFQIYLKMIGKKVIWIILTISTLLALANYSAHLLKKSMLEIRELEESIKPVLLYDYADASFDKIVEKEL